MYYKITKLSNVPVISILKHHGKTLCLCPSSALIKAVVQIRIRDELILIFLPNTIALLRFLSISKLVKLTAKNTTKLYVTTDFPY